MNIVHNVDDAIVLFGADAVNSVGEYIMSADIVIKEAITLFDFLVEQETIEPSDEAEFDIHLLLAQHVVAQLFGMFDDRALEGWDTFNESAQEYIVAGVAANIVNLLSDNCDECSGAGGEA